MSLRWPWSPRGASKASEGGASKRGAFEERTCRTCATVWRVDVRLARMKRPGRWRSGFSVTDLRAAQQRMPTDQVMGDLFDSMHRRGHDANIEHGVIDDLRHCPSCGDTHFRRRMVAG